MRSPDTAPPATPSAPSSAPARAEVIADTAIALLAERGLRGLTHRAVDEAAGLPQGSTSNHARTRAALLEAAVRQLAVREGAVLTPDEMGRLAAADGTPAELADLIATALHRYLTGHRALLVARYELALEATRRPALRAHYDRTGTAAFTAPLTAALTAAGSPAPARHALALLAWCDGLLFSCTAGSYHDAPPTEAELRTTLRELLTGLLGERP